MSFRRHLIAGVLVGAAWALAAEVSGQGPDPVAGAWEHISSKNLATGAIQPLPNPPLHVVYLDGHYVQFTAAANRPKSQTPIADLTKEQLLARFDMQGQFGTYRTEGTKLVRRIISAANPNIEGLENTVEFRIERDVLVAVGNLGGLNNESRFRRLK